MFQAMKLYSFLKSDILKLTSRFIVPSKSLSSEVVELEKPNEKVFYRKMKSLYTPSLNSEDLQELRTICSVSIAINHVSWTNISIPDLNVLNWNAYTLPQDFGNIANENQISIIANKIKLKIPQADKYVMENQKRYMSNVNELYLRAMLILLLNYERDLENQSAVVVQKSLVLNHLHKLMVGSERKCAKPLVIKLLQDIKGKNYTSLITEENPKWYSQLQITGRHRECFKKSTFEKQESLSIAFLLALSFVNKNYYET